jgi:hypothetical protein
MSTFVTIVDRLSAASAASSPLPLDWPVHLDPHGWAMSPEWISVHGTPAFSRLDAAAVRRLALLEAVHFFSLNIHGERRLMAGLATRLYRADSGDHDGYLHHFLAEENEHSAMFARFCRQYLGKVYPERKLALPDLADRPRSEADLLFYAQVLLFEEIVDRYNAALARDARLFPIVRAIHARHHADECRHLAFGRQMLLRLAARHPVTKQVQHELLGFLTLTLREYFNADVYADAGLPDPYGLPEEAFASPERRAFRAQVAGPAVRFLHSLSLLASPEVP